MSSNIKLSVELKPPFLTGNADTPEMEYDAIMPCDKYGYLVFPGTLVKGTLRDVLETMLNRLKGETGLIGLKKEETKTLIGKIFGQESQAEKKGDAQMVSANAYEPDRGEIIFNDLKSTDRKEDYQSSDSDADKKSRSKTRIERNTLTGAAVEGSLQKMEVIGNKENPVIPFEARLSVEDGLDSEKVCKLFNLAAKAIHALGSSKSAGLGRVNGVLKFEKGDSAASNLVDIEVDEADEAVKTLYLELALDGPLVINTARSGTNTYTSDSIIPGGALKASIAAAVGNHNEKFNEALSEVTISHGYPVLAKSDDETSQEHWLPTALPHSAAIFPFDSENLCVDLAKYDDAFLFKKRKKISGPKMEIDWKSGERKSACCKIEEALNNKGRSLFSDGFLQRKSMVRTAIDYQSGSAEMDEEGVGKLFVQEAVLPTVQAENGKQRKVVWRFCLNSTQEGNLAKIFKELKGKALHLGKLKSQASLLLVSSKSENKVEIAPASSTEDRNFYHIHIQSPSLMVSCDALTTGDNNSSFAGYFNYWLGNACKLERSFVTFETRGGYQALRYRENKTSYMPWMLVEPGSVFVISVPKDDDSAKGKLESAMTFGMPLCEKYIDMDWEKCPFLPENGYGAIDINPIAEGDLSASEDAMIILAEEQA